MQKKDFYISTRDLNVSLVFLSLSATQWLFRSPTLILLTRSTTPGAPTSSIGLNAPDTGEHDPDLWTTVVTIPLHGNKQHSPTRHIKIKMPVCQCLYYQVLMLPAVIVVVRVGMVMAVWLSSDITLVLIAALNTLSSMSRLKAVGSISHCSAVWHSEASCPSPNVKTFS